VDLRFARVPVLRVQVSGSPSRTFAFFARLNLQPATSILNPQSSILNPQSGGAASSLWTIFKRAAFVSLKPNTPLFDAKRARII
jgi:hypothetical protein